MQATNTPRRVARLAPMVLMLVAAATAPALASGLTPETLWQMIRLGDPQPSPDGQRVVFVAREYDLEENSSTSSLWVAPLGGGGPSRLTRAQSRDHSPRWLADSRIILFLSNRSGSSQIWAVDRSGGEAYQVSHLALDVANLAISPDGTSVAFSLEVYPDCEDLGCTVDRVKQQEENPSSARVYTELLFRHWDSWEDGRRSHLFVAPLLRPAPDAPPTAVGAPRDLMRGMDADSPPRPFGGGEEYAFSPDSKEITFAAKVLSGSEAAWSTDVDLFRVGVSAASAPEKITTTNRALDTQPAYSPDGKWLAHLAMKRPGFEADRQRLVLRPRHGQGEARVLAEDWDRSVSSLTWSGDSSTLVVTAQEQGRLKIFTIAVADGVPRVLVDIHHNTSVSVAAGGKVVYLQDSATSPAVLMTVPRKGGASMRLAALNESRLGALTLSSAEDFWFEGAHGERVHGWLFRPVGYRAGKTYPVAFLVHGGPQGAWQDQFHYRWNPQIYAAAGYITLAINFHGSTGYGQAFTDSISGDWGGAPYEDLMKGLDHLASSEPAADMSRVCALGASYGGYMINWMAGHTDRFSCLINHDGVFDTASTYFSTEELWFPEWEFGGTPWEKRELYERWSPARFVDRWKTPMLVIHGAMDFRLPDTEAFGAFTALRRRGIPAKLLHFPDENHWVLRPANAQVWHRSVLDWMARWTAKD